MASKYDKYWHEKFKKIDTRIARHEAKIASILQSAMERPERSAKFWNGIRSSIRAEYVAIGKIFNGWAKSEIPTAYRYFLSDQQARVKALKAIRPKAQYGLKQLYNLTATNQIIEALYTDAINDMRAALLQGNLRISRLTRKTQQALIAEYLVDSSVAAAYEAGSLNIAQIVSRQGTLANSLVEQAKGGRFVTVTGQSGKTRTYTASYYAEMVSRVKFHEAQNQATLQMAANYETDLIRISSHNTTTEICQQYEGKIFSISGKDNRFETLDQEPPFHVNCLHYSFLVFIESLNAQGATQGFSDFSLGKTDRPPTTPTFVPVSERPEIVRRGTEKAKSSDEYKAARSDRRKRAIIRDEIAREMSRAA